MSNLTVERMMLIHPFSECRVIVGKQGLSNHIQYMGVLDAPDSVKFVKQDEFVLSSGYIFSDNDELTVEIISELCKRRAAGLGIKMFRYINSLPEQAIRIAQRYNFPILFVPNKFSWFELISPFVKESISFDKHESFISNIKLYDSLITSLSQSKNYLDAIENAAKIIETTCGVLNINDMSTFLFPTTFGNEIDINSRIFTDSSLSINLNGAYFSEKAYMDYDILFTPFAIDKYTHMVFFDKNIKENSARFKHLVYCMEILNNSLQKFTKHDNLYQKVQALVLKTLITGEIDINQFLVQAANLNITLHKNYFVTACHLKSKSLKNLKLVGTDTHLFPYTNLLRDLYIKYDILSCFNPEGVLFLFIPYKNKHTDVLKMIQSILKQVADIKNTLTNYNGNFKFSFGISNISPLSDSLIWSVKEAIDALNIGDVLFGDVHITHVRNINLYRLIHNNLSSGLAENFLNSYLEPINKIEKNLREKLLETLSAYIESNYNARECGRRLGLHYNTVHYRLEQIYDLTGLNPYYCDDLYILQTCLYIMKLLNNNITINLSTV